MKKSRVSSNTGGEQHRTERLFALTLAGFIALNYPFLYLFNGPGMVFGIPLLYLYLYLVWGAFMVLVGVCLEHITTNKPSAGKRSHARSGE